MKLDHKKIAIVGGGPSGLTLARLLQLQGVDVKVYERDFDKNARVQGSPLDMHEDSGLEAIRKAELFDVFKTKFRPGADRKIITDEKARIFLSDNEGKPEENFGHAHFRPEIDRGPLRNMFLESLNPETVVWDSHFISMQPKGEGWQMHFKNGLSAYADIVIAADGANSKIRPYLTDIKPIYSGITMLEINVPDSGKATPYFNQLMDGGKIMAFGNAQCLLGGQKGNGDLGFYLSFKTDENWVKKGGLDYSDKTQLFEWFRKEYSGWDSIWDELIENASTPVVPRPIYCMPLNQDWPTLPNLTMIGDAAHVMPPFAGEGANMAMLDALELSKCLASDTYETVEEAISFYEKTMRERAAIASKESLDNGETMHSEKALDVMLKMFGNH